MSQGFSTISAGEQGEEITQTAGDMTELTYNPYKWEETNSRLRKVKQEFQGPYEDQKRDDGCDDYAKPSGDRGSYFSSRILISIAALAQWSPQQESQSDKT